MKKRIISLILVVAMAFLTLTGCSYNYAKDDMTKYATFDAQKFLDELTKLVIEDGDFGTDEEARKVKVQDAIAEAILKATDADKKYAGTVEKYDSLYYCYIAEDEDGNLFFASKMDESKPSTVQVGLSSLKDFSKAVSDAILAEGADAIGDIASYIYSTSAAETVGDKDVVSIYCLEKKDSEEGLGTPTVKYFEVIDGNASDELSTALIGRHVGEELEYQYKITTEEGGTSVTRVYSNVEIISIVKDNSAQKVQNGTNAFVTYTVSFDATEFYNADTQKYDLPENFNGTVDGNKKYKGTVSYEMIHVTVDPEHDTDDEKTFAEFLVSKEAEAGKSVDGTITVKNYKVGEKTVEASFTSVKVNWIVNNSESINKIDDLLNTAIKVKYTPYTEAVNAEKTNEKKEKNIYGEEIVLNEKELTYYVFPIYYVDVANVSAEVILTEFASIVNSTKTIKHDHTEEGHTDHTDKTEFVFATLQNDGDAFTFVKEGDEDNNKSLKALVAELVTKASKLTEAEKTLTDAAKALLTAQQNYAKDTSDAGSPEKATLNDKLTNATEDYNDARVAVDAAESEVTTKVANILACKKGEAGVAEKLVEDFTKYHYDTLEEAYKADITKKLATKIIAALNDETNISFKGNLPKKAVKQAYKAIMNTYKNDFYEGKYSSGTSSSTSSANAQTNYKFYGGDFELYLIDKVTNKKGDMKAVKAAVQKQAEETVQEIIRVYVFAEMVSGKWGDADLILTKDEKKEMKKNLESTAILYQQYGLSFTYNVDDSYHAGQFDKVMNFLLETRDADVNNGEDKNIVYFKNINYTATAKA